MTQSPPGYAFMLKKVKYGKTLAVIFLTVLIWVWADLALDEELVVTGATVTVAKSNPKLWVSFDDESSDSIEELVLKGPASRIAEFDRELREGKELEFYFDAGQEKMEESGNLLFLPFLQKNKEIKRLGLKVESCKPEKLPVTVRRLAKKPLKVKCVDEDQNPVNATVDPGQVDMFVPQGWAGEKLIAWAQLTPGEIGEARLSAIKKTPYVTLLGDEIREANRTVKITILPEEGQRMDYFVRATLGIAKSPNVEGKYKVVVTNRDEVLGPIAIRATPDAKRAYEMQPYPMTLYILDDDIKKGAEEQRREVVYNFPSEFFRKGEIDLKNPQQRAEARFKLIELAPISSTETTAGTIE